MSIERGFASRPIEGASGLVYMRARHYDPTTGRFLQPDPEGIASTQRYAFAEHNPYIYNDPTGRSSRGIGSLDRGVPPSSFEKGGLLANNFGGPFMLNDGPTLQTQAMMNAMGSAGGAAGPQPLVQPFNFDPVPGSGSTRGEFFIEAPSAMLLRGDNRSFDPGPNPVASRAFFDVNFETGHGVVQINPTCSAVGGFCRAPLPIGEGNELDISISGSTIDIVGSLTQSLMRPVPLSWIPSITFGVTVSPSGTTGYRDRGYPSFELTRTINGSTEVLFKSKEVSPFCLTGICGEERF